MRLRFALLFSVFITTAASGQAPKTIPEAGVGPSGGAGGCSPGTAEARLNEADVEAELYNVGALFWREAERTYEVPRGGGADALFTAGLWVSGEIAGVPRFAGATYGRYEFWPGPLDASGQTDSATCDDFDRLWSVTASEVEAYNAGLFRVVPPDLAEWPVAWGAPFYVDANGNSRNDPEAEPVVQLDLGDQGYGTRALDLEAGERPLLLGDQAVFWIMNDAGNEHPWSTMPALGVEVHVLAFVVDSPDPAIAQSTFYRYTIHNRSRQTIEDSRVSFYADIDLGYYGDDYMASDSTRGMLIGYNADEDDVGRDGSGYRTPPPAIGLDLLSGAFGVIKPRNQNFPGPGQNGEAAYRLQRSQWDDGTRLTVGGKGYNPGSTAYTDWLLSGDPVTYSFWTEEDPSGRGRANGQGDRLAVLNGPPASLAPGESRTVDLAILFGQGENRMHSVAKLRTASDSVQSAYHRGGLAAIRDAIVGPGPAPPLPPAQVTTLLAPDEGQELDVPEPSGDAEFAWVAASGADAYLLEFSPDPDFRTVSHQVQTLTPSASVSRYDLPPNVARSYWRVAAVNWGGRSPESEVRSFVYPRFQPGIVRLGDGSPAFVEVVGPGGIDPCGPEAASTDGCDEVGGNGIYGSLNSTLDYAGVEGSDGTEVLSPGLSDDATAPHDFEIRFTEAGSYAYHVIHDWLVRVPFEVWDVGVVPPGTENDPSDDRQLMPLLASYGSTGAEPDRAECVFGYVVPAEPGSGPRTQSVFGVYVVDDDYASFAEAASGLVATAPDGCVDAPASDMAETYRDRDRGVPLAQVVLEQGQPEGRDPVGIDGLTGTVLRFYTTDPPATPAEPRPEAGGLALAVHPNPVRAAASVPYAVATPGHVRLRLVDVLGREVAMLADGERPAGEHRASFDTRGLAPGVYVVVLDTEAGRTSRTITVVR
ncbi:MAG: T9SS type A sorting domain-containing protein [Bacteroidota bacterium]